MVPVEATGSASSDTAPSSYAWTVDVCARSLDTLASASTLCYLDHVFDKVVVADLPPAIVRVAPEVITVVFYYLDGYLELCIREKQCFVCVVRAVQWVNPARLPSAQLRGELALFESIDSGGGATTVPSTALTCNGVCALSQLHGRVLVFPLSRNGSQLFDLAPELADFVKTKRCTKDHLVQFFWSYAQVGDTIL